MVLELFFEYGLWLVDYIIEFMPALEPAVIGVTSMFGRLLSFGVWVIGDDMWLAILTNIAAWLTFKLSWGIVLFAYKLLPFT